MILLDTSVLVYAVGDEERFRAPCRRLLEMHAEGAVQAATTVEVIQEFTHVRARRRSRADATGLAEHCAVALELITVGMADLELGLALFRESPSLGSFDSVLAAVALNRGVEALVSADRGFGSVPRLRWIDAGSPALETLLTPPGHDLS